MAYTPEIRQKVRASYVFDRLAIEAAAEKHGIGVASARRWKSAAAGQGDDWDRARAASALTMAGNSNIAQLVLADYLILHQSTVEDLKTAQDIPPLGKAEALSRLADAFTKTMAAVAKAAPDLGRLAVATELLQDMATFVRAHYPAHAPALAEILEPFALEMARKYS